MSENEALRTALADLLKHAEHANDIMLREAGIGVCDVTAIAAARAMLAQTATGNLRLAAQRPMGWACKPFDFSDDYVFTRHADTAQQAKQLGMVVTPLIALDEPKPA